MRLKDRVVIITGAAQGIGKVYAIRCAREGAKLVLTDIQDTGPAAEEIRALEVDGEVNGGVEVLALQTDVSDEQQTDAMAEAAIERFGSIDVLVNNAAIFANIPLQDFWDINAKEWDRVMEVNVKGIVLGVKSVLPHMRKQGSGKIINIASGVAFKGTPWLMHYVSSKGAVVSMTRSMARELGQFNIAVNAIAPGYTLSEGVLAHPEHIEKMGAAILEARCFKRDQEPEDLAGTLVYLASADSDFVTGQIIAVDGGSVMH